MQMNQVEQMLKEKSVLSKRQVTRDDKQGEQVQAVISLEQKKVRVETAFALAK